jgi:hypothetical protein
MRTLDWGLQKNCLAQISSGFPKYPQKMRYSRSSKPHSWSSKKRSLKKEIIKLEEII